MRMLKHYRTQCQRGRVEFNPNKPVLPWLCFRYGTATIHFATARECEAYFERHGMTLITPRVLLRVVREDGLHDPWGTAMHWLFALCDYMTETALKVPDEWYFRQSPGGADEDNDAFQTLQELDPSPNCLQHMGAVLWRYKERQERHGRNY